MKAKSEPVRATSAKVIIQDGWSDPAAHSFEEFRLADAGVCLATRSEADEAMRKTSLGRGLAILTVNIALRKRRCCFQSHVGCLLLSEKVLVPRFPATRCSPRTDKFGPTSTIFRSSVLLSLQAEVSVSFFVNPLFAQFRSDLLHLPAIVKSLRVMCLKNLLCPLPTGCFERQQFGHCIHEVFGYERAVSVCLCPCPSSNHGSESQARG